MFRYPWLFGAALVLASAAMAYGLTWLVWAPKP